MLDPFSGAGTVALVADRLQRNAIGIEINAEYVAMSERRLREEASSRRLAQRLRDSRQSTGSTAVDDGTGEFP